jgi:hypothetical protein
MVAAGAFRVAWQRALPRPCRRDRSGFDAIAVAGAEIASLPPLAENLRNALEKPQLLSY